MNKRRRPRRFAEGDPAPSLTPRDLLRLLQEQGFDGEALDGCPPAAMAEALRVVSDLRDQLRQAKGEVGNLTPEQKASLAEAYYERYSEQFQKYGTSKADVLRLYRNAPDTLIRSELLPHLSPPGGS